MLSDNKSNVHLEKDMTIGSEREVMLYSEKFSHLFHELFYFCRAAVSHLTRAGDWHGHH